MKLYGFVVSTHRTLENGYSQTTHSPIMWLDPNVQGLVSCENAARVALRMAREIASDPDVRVWVHVWSSDASDEPITMGDDPMKEVLRTAGTITDGEVRGG